MKTRVHILSAVACFLLSAAPVSAGVILFAEGPSSASDGAEVEIRLKARLTESINAMATTVLITPATTEYVRFDDRDSAIRLWLQRGIAVEGGVRLEGVIPGGIGPAFTDVIDLGSVWVRPSASGTLQVSFRDSQVYLNQPTPMLSDVTSTTLSIRVGQAVEVGDGAVSDSVVLDADVRVVREPSLSDGARSVVFDIKTDRGTVDTVRIRERWLGVYGTWREVTSPSTLSDSWGVSILDVALSDSVGGAHVASVTPALLKSIWALAALGIGMFIRGYLKIRH